MKEWKIVILCFCMCLITGLAVNMLNTFRIKKIAVVDAVKLFDRFNLKKELEQKETIKLEHLRKQLDSVESQMKLAEAAQDKAVFEKLAYTYGYFKSGFQKEYEQSNRDINEKVWKRLNPAVEEFGKGKGFHVIIGANGMGSVLYNDDYFDVTEELIQFVNRKYEEGR